MATVAVMLLLARGKLVTGRLLDTPVLQIEARVTLVDAYLAAAVLVGLSLDAGLGWWWSDPWRPWSSSTTASAKDGRHGRTWTMRRPDRRDVMRPSFAEALAETVG